jgi:hypothetical protein
MAQDPVLFSVHEACERWTGRTQVEVSQHAQLLVGYILEAVLVDPHPKWHATHARLQEGAANLLTSIPNHLEDIAQHIEDQTTITSFDVLYWLTDNMVEECPF